MNFDGASWGNLGASRAGCMIHSFDEVVEAKQAKPLAEDTNNVAEIQVAIEGLTLCEDFGLKKVEIEGELAIIINTLRFGNTPNWRLNSVLSRAIELLKCLDTCTINHVFREANGMVDQLTNRGVDGFNEKPIKDPRSSEIRDPTTK
ncbi:uncharacterized protein LOC131048148 [Cryptomeria japonica]|uniref:uncharacterized protein LOC131048148 n=1 Tax=Cryptomeria japonica TaxID=3369 RepID=UPI0027DA4CCC|nr:uncharacterized protein LOC131048148 [Cryptomeria japonica]